MDSYLPKLKALQEAVLASPGVLPPSTREAIAAGRDVPPALARHVDTVVRHAWRVTPEDIDALRAAGQSEDALFEATVSAALGVGLKRLEQGLRHLPEEP